MLASISPTMRPTVDEEEEDEEDELDEEHCVHELHVHDEHESGQQPAQLPVPHDQPEEQEPRPRARVLFGKGASAGERPRGAERASAGNKARARAAHDARRMIRAMARIIDCARV